MEVKEEMIESEISKSAVLQDVSDELDLKAKKYLRGDGANLEVLQDKKLKGQLAVREKLYGQSAKAAAKAEKWLLPCEEGYLEGEGLEKTWRIKQEDILKEVDNNSSRKPFDMILPELGPYTLGYTTSGRYMMMGGRKGHLAMIDMISMDLIKEFQVRETVRDVVFLQNDHFLAVAQKKYPYIYNRHGTEIHCLKEVSEPTIMVAFPIIGDPYSASLVAWTTRPWTLLSNLAPCINKSFIYVKVRDKLTGATYIVAESLLSSLPVKKPKVDGTGSKHNSANSKSKDTPDGNVKGSKQGSTNSKSNSKDIPDGETKGAVDTGPYELLGKVEGASLVGLNHG